MSFHYESDGGGWGKVSQPKTHYVTDDLETRIDCDTASQARRLAKELNDATPEKREALLHSLREKGTPAED